MKTKEELTKVVEIVQKDKGQFELLYSLIANKVYYWCYNIVGNEATAKDLAQDSMIKVYQKLDTLDNAKVFNTWLYILVRNLCYNYLRLNKTADTDFLESEDYEEGYEEMIAEGNINHLPEESYDLKETKKLIIDFVESLPTRQKEIIMLFYLEEFNVREIAKMLDYKVATVKSNLYYGRKNLEKQITEYEERNSIRLHSKILLPLLGTILLEYSKEISSKQDLRYDKSNYKLQETTRISSLKSFVSAPSISTVGVGLVVVMVVMTSLFGQTKQSGGTANQGVNLTDSLAMYNKIHKNPYIKSITYSTFPTRDNTILSIYLKKDVDEQKISILFGEEMVEFEKDGREIIVIARQNGDYQIDINGKKTMFTVTMIDAYAPELTSMDNYGDKLQLYIKDEKSRIDYAKSYVLYENKQYKITDKNQVIGNFTGKVEVYIFNDINQYIHYELDLQ